METKQEDECRGQEIDEEILSPWRLGWRSFKRDKIGVVRSGDGPVAGCHSPLRELPDPV